MSALCTHSCAEYLHLPTRVQTPVNRDYAVDLPLQKFGYCVKKLASSIASSIADFLFIPQEFRDKTYFEPFLDKVASCPQFILYLNLCSLLVCSNLFKCKHLSAQFGSIFKWLQRYTISRIVYQLRLQNGHSRRKILIIQQCNSYCECSTQVR